MAKMLCTHGTRSATLVVPGAVCETVRDDVGDALWISIAAGLALHDRQLIHPLQQSG